MSPQPSPAPILVALRDRTIVQTVARLVAGLHVAIKYVDSAADAGRFVRTTAIDVLVTDSSDVSATVHDAAPTASVILLASTPALSAAVAALRTGAFDYIPTDEIHTRLPVSIPAATRAARRAHAFSQLETAVVDLNRAPARASSNDAQPPASPCPLSLLTAREREVVTLLARGDRPGPVASRLCISTHTVRSHLKSIYRKLGVGSQLELVALIGRSAPPPASAETNEL